MLVPVIVLDTEVATTGAVDRSMTLAMATWQRLPGFGVPFVGGLINGVLGGY